MGEEAAAQEVLGGEVDEARERSGALLATVPWRFATPCSQPVERALEAPSLVGASVVAGALRPVARALRPLTSHEVFGPWARGTCHVHEHALSSRGYEHASWDISLQNRTRRAAGQGQVVSMHDQPAVRAEFR